MTRVAVSLVVALALGGCGIPSQDRPVAIDPSSLPPRLGQTAPTTTATPPIDAATRRQLDLWFVGADGLASASVSVDRATELAAILDTLAEPPAGSVLRTAVPPEVVVSADVALGQATIELSEQFAEVLPAEQILAIAQLVLTATEFPGVGLVRFTSDGEPITVPGSDGRQIDGAVTRDDYTDMLAP